MFFLLRFHSQKNHNHHHHHHPPMNAFVSVAYLFLVWIFPDFSHFIFLYSLSSNDLTFVPVSLNFVSSFFFVDIYLRLRSVIFFFSSVLSDLFPQFILSVHQRYHIKYYCIFIYFEVNFLRFIFFQQNVCDTEFYFFHFLLYSSAATLRY